jgi:predicted Fe-Mo cluster-binding NifX family protein
MHHRYAIPLSDPQATTSEHFGEAPYFALIDVRLSDGAIQGHRVLDRPSTEGEKGKGIQVAEWLVEQNVDTVLVQEDMHGKGPLYVLRDAGIELGQVDPNVAKDSLDRIIEWTREQKH